MSKRGSLTWEKRPGLHAAVITTTFTVVAYFLISRLETMGDGAGRAVLGAMALVLFAMGVWMLRRCNRSDWGLLQTIGLFLSAFMVLLGVDCFLGAAFDTMLMKTRWGAVIGLSLVLSVGFLIGYGLLQVTLSLPWRPLGVARAIIAEAMAYRVVVGVVGALFLGVVAIPLMIGQTEYNTLEDIPTLYDRMRKYLSFSFMFVSAMLSLMTVVLSCWSLSNEVDQRYVYTTLTKPISRGGYLLGKWLGVMLLNGLLVLVVGIAMYGFTVFYLAKMDPIHALDENAVSKQLLTARIASTAQPPEELEKLADDELERIRVEFGDRYIDERGGDAVFREEILGRLLGEWRSVAPYGRENYRRVYKFTGLDTENRSDEFNAQIQYTLRAGSSVPKGQARVGWTVNGSPITEVDGIEVPLRIRQTLPFQSSRINDDGTVLLELFNLTPGSSLYFSGFDNLQVMHEADGFSGNFARAMMIVWIKLMFFAALGLTMSTFLNFYVSILGSLLVLIAASSGSYILEAASHYGIGPDALLIEQALHYIAVTFTWPLQQYSSFEPGKHIVDGLYISWGQLGRCVLVLGVIWTGLAGLIGWGIFARRELARVQV